MSGEQTAWRLGLRAAVVATLLIAGLRGALLETGLPDPVEFLFGAATGAFVLAVSWFLWRRLLAVWPALPAPVLALALALLATLWVLDDWSMAELWRTFHEPGSLGGRLPVLHGLSLLAVVTIVAAVGLLTVVVDRSRYDAAALALAPGGLALFTVTMVAAAASAVIVFSLVHDGRDPWPTTFRTLGPDVPPGVAPLDAPDPGQPGAHAIERLTYGAGANVRRPEFGSDRDLTSRTVDATRLLPEWKGLRGRIRERYWGFSLEEAPLNAIVWAPAGEGPFPLVLIVHGNHSMVDVSDPGYAYLGELLASRGFIVASVDENYINGSWSGDFRGREMAARAWLLLEHLSLWRDWNAVPDHPFEGRVDLERIALVGHSRGGEAVSIAHAFDGLAHDPDDAGITFDYGFDIDALVAIAQVDQRYQRRVELDDVSFLALQGSYDADEPAFHGLRQYNRIDLSPATDHFKAGLYVHGANHGQFNEGWGRKDYGPPGAWLLNLAPLIDGEVQRRIAAVSISAFLEATLNDDARYRGLFRDPRRGAAWLPEGIYLHQYTDASFVPVADFEEDLDVTSGSVDGVRIRTEDVALWREEQLRHRDGRLQGTSVAVLGWHAGTAPQVEIMLPDGLPVTPEQGEPLLTFGIAPSPERAPPRAAEAEDDAGETPPAPARSRDAGAPTDAFEFEVELVDAAGRSVRMPSSAFARVAPPVRVQYMKSAALNAARYDALWEAVLQTVEVPLAGVAVEEIRTVRLHFAGARAGTVILDEVGLRSVPAP